MCHRIAAAEALVSLVSEWHQHAAAAGSLDTSEARRVETDSSETGQRAAGRQHSPARVGGKVSAADGHTRSAHSDRAELAGSRAPFTAVLSPRLYSASVGRTARCAHSTLLTSLQIDKLKQALVQKDCEIIELQQVTRPAPDTASAAL